jgi:hypothetical protein
MRFDFRELAPETTSMSDVELCPLARWVPMVADQRGLLRVVLARLRMNDCRFSCMLRSSLALSSIVRSLLLALALALSLRGTRRTLFRLLSAPTRNVLDSTNDSCVGGRGKSEGRVLSMLVPRVVTEPQLLLSIVASNPILLAFRRLPARWGLRVELLIPMPRPASSSD